MISKENREAVAVPPAYRKRLFRGTSVFYIIYALFAMSHRKTYYLSGLVKKRAKNKAFYPVFAFLTLFPEIT